MHKLQTVLNALAIAVLSMVSSPAVAGTLCVPENHKSIQAAINAAADGDTVLVSAGTYRERVRLKPNVTLRSAGDDTKGKLGLKRAEETIIDGTGGDEDSAGVSMAEGSRIDGFTVTGVGTYDDDEWKKHHATQGEEQSYDRIGKPGVAGIAVVRVTDCEVLNNIVHHIGYTGIVTMGGEGIRVSAHIHHNECYDNDMAGIGAMKDAAPILRHNRCYRNAEAGIGCQLGATPLIEFNECFENGMSGIGCRSGAAPVIRNNRCYKNEMSGIGSQDSARPVIVGNECFENVMAGIGTEEDAQAIIRDNKCYRNLQAGIGARTGARPIIDGNHCYENLLAGIGVEDKAESLVRGNRCEKNEQSGIGVQKGARALIIDNQCDENALSGIGVREQATAFIIENKCIENKAVAIGVRNESQAQITGNKLSRTGGMPPMIAVQEESKALITGNTITGGGVAGVLVNGTATITGNQFDGNGPRKGPGPPNFAVWVHGGSTVSFLDNRVDRWRHALSASDAKSVLAIDNTAAHFIDTAIVVQNTKQPAHVSGNVAISESQNDQVIRITGPQGVVAENVRRADSTPREDLPPSSSVPKNSSE